MKLFNLTFLLLITWISLQNCFQFKDEQYMLKMTENFYLKENITNNLNEFSEFLFAELESNYNHRPHSHHHNGSKYHKEEHHHHLGDFRFSIGDYFSSKRIVKLYVSRNQECSIFVNDTVNYEKTSNFNFIEHMILHNNADVVEPKGVYSDDIVVNFFAFNKKLNIFNVNFDNPHNRTNFTIEYDYDAINLIKTNSDMNYTGNNLFFGHKYNSFVWKIINQNLLKFGEIIEIHLYFKLGKDFENVDIDFNLNFTKSIEFLNNTHIDHANESIVKYSWEGMLKPQEVIILEAKFPLYFENCSSINLNFFYIIIGATFIAFLIGMLHMILSTVCFQEY